MKWDNPPKRRYPGVDKHYWSYRPNLPVNKFDISDRLSIGEVLTQAGWSAKEATAFLNKLGIYEHDIFSVLPEPQREALISALRREEVR